MADPRKKESKSQPKVGSNPSRQSPSQGPSRPASHSPPGGRSRSSSPDGPKKITCQDLIEEGLPNLVISTPQRRTEKASTSGGHQYEGQIRKWVDFDEEVERLIYTRHSPDNKTEMLYRPPAHNLAPIETESYCCAEEKGVEGAFNRQVMHHVQKAADLQGREGLPVMICDFRGTSHGSRWRGDKPDFACAARDSEQGARFVGECKADWDNRMKEDYISTQFNQDRLPLAGDDAKIKIWLKQIAHYLKVCRLQYGFITTYNYTMFVHYEMSDLTSPQETFEDSILVSRPISHRQRYIHEQRDQPPLVSVRQAMWFLMIKASSSDSKDWEMQHGTAGTRTRRDNRSADQRGQAAPQPAPGNPGGRNPQQSGPGNPGVQNPRGGQPGAATGNQRTKNTGDLTQQLGNLSVGNQGSASRREGKKPAKN